MNRNKRVGTKRLASSVLAVVLLGALTGQMRGVEFNIPRPGERDFIRDLAKLIDEEDAAKIKAICEKLLTEKATPIIVVTIPSMAAVGGRTMRIETFARLLFDKWGIGHEKIKINRETKNWNTGILLLVSKGDRKARIELGAYWGRRQDAFCKEVMDERIIPLFKRGDFSGGILAGVESLSNMANGKLEMAPMKRPWWHYGLIVGFVGLIIFTVVSLIRRRSSGWAWLFWGVIFALIGALLYSVLTSSGRSGGGGFSGGSFGGGFSGGGGASGSW